MIHKPHGFISFGAMTLLIGGLALIGLLFYGAQSGHELPFWPAALVIGVNIIASAKLFMDAKKAKQARQTEASNPPPRKGKKPSR